MAVWCPQRSRDRWSRSSSGECVSAFLLMWRGVLPSKVFKWKVPSVLLK